VGDGPARVGAVVAGVRSICGSAITDREAPGFRMRVSAPRLACSIPAMNFCDRKRPTGRREQIPDVAHGLSEVQVFATHPLERRNPDQLSSCVEQFYCGKCEYTWTIADQGQECRAKGPPVRTWPTTSTEAVATTQTCTLRADLGSRSAMLSRRVG